jgi:hypothetical protein
LPRSRHIAYIAAILILAAFILIYRGPAWPFVRGFVSDWLIVQLIYLVARFWVPDRRRYQLAAAIFLLGVVVELIQALVTLPQNLVAELTIGSTFDLLDILAYALGVITVLLIERAISKP